MEIPAPWRAAAAAATVLLGSWASTRLNPGSVQLLHAMLCVLPLLLTLVLPLLLVPVRPAALLGVILE